MARAQWKVLLAMLAVLLLPVTAGVVSAAVKGKAETVREDKKDGDDKDDEGDEIDLKDLPKVVGDAVNAAVPGGTIKEAEKETKGNVVIYEVKTKTAKEVFEVKVDAAGKVISKKIDDDDDDEDDKKKK